MNKPLRFVAAAAATTLLLAGCSDSAEPESDATSGSPSAESGDFGSAADVATLEQITWTEDESGVPTLEFETPGSVSAASTRIVNEGEGDLIEAGDIIQVSYTIVDGSDGSELYSTYSYEAPEYLNVEENLFDPELYNAFLAATPGSDIIYASVGTTSTSEEESTVLMALTVDAVMADVPESATGTEVEPTTEGLPTVTFGEGDPTISFEGATESEELVAETLIQGEGAPLEQGDVVAVNYTGWLWDGETFDSSWSRGYPAAFEFVEGMLIDGWIQGLEGVNIGSRVLLVIPSDLGYGDEGNSSIPGGSTLVFVVDLLDTME
ncbi:FKBP-type peptidyl-prolyl cis-trans isomerase [Demequina sp.]|uniref:FKBP-type peptidyl-prolyl cis-trans isomerase n=1 Tax=Demequina sp. TaxID=2050685 RepID=UPI003A8A8AC3